MVLSCFVLQQESFFCPANKAAFERPVQFLNVMVSGEKLPDRLKKDARNVWAVLTADVAEVAEVLNAIAIMEGIIKRQQDQFLGGKNKVVLRTRTNMLLGIIRYMIKLNLCYRYVMIHDSKL